jgi:hypothetical protein
MKISIYIKKNKEFLEKLFSLKGVLKLSKESKIELIQWWENKYGSMIIPIDGNKKILIGNIDIE